MKIRDTIIAAIVGAILALSIRDAFTLRELRESNERIEHLQFEVKTLTHTVGEVNAAIANRQPAITNGTGGAQ